MKNRRIQINKQYEIKAPVETVFPLLCPFGEYRWIPGWKFELVHCPNKRNELGTIFQEVLTPSILMGSPFGKTTWTTVLHDPENYNIHFKLENSASETLYKIDMSDTGKGATLITIDVKYQALNWLGDRVIANNGKEKILFMYDFLFQMLIHYSENQTMITLSQLGKRVSRPKSLTFVDKICLMVGQFRQSMLRKIDT